MRRAGPVTRPGHRDDHERLLHVKTVL